MYADNSLIDNTRLFQGDVIVDFPFPILEGVKQIKKNNDTGQYEPSTEPPEDGKLAFAMEAKVQSVMILSQTCDLQRRVNVIICPVYKLQDFINDNTINTDKARSIRERKINYLFYLPAYQLLDESIVDLQTMVYVPRIVLEGYLMARIVSLSDLGRHHLGWALSSYFGRPIED